MIRDKGSPKSEVGSRMNYILLRVSCLLLLASCFLLPASSIQAEFNAKGAGTSGAAFLKIGAGARPAALGDAYTGIADDANAIYWNTAGLSSLKKAEFVAMRADLFQDLKYHFFALAYPLGRGGERGGTGEKGRFGTIGLGISNLNISGIEARSADTDAADTTFGSNDTAYTLAYSYKMPFLLPGGIHLGLGTKFIRQSLSADSANTVAADIGSLYQMPNMPLTLGLAVQNLGTSSKFKDTADPLPMTMKVGASYRLGETWKLSGDQDGEHVGLKNGLLLALDVNIPRDNDPSVRFGTEFTRMWGENIGTSLRGSGYQAGKGEVGQMGGFGFGGGIGFTFRALTFDFAWKPYRDLGDTYRYSVRLRF